MKKILFIPAAGLGSRLGAMTADRPKALVEYRARPLIGYVLDKAGRAGFTEAVVNVHHHADRLETYLWERGLMLEQSQEREWMPEREHPAAGTPADGQSVPARIRCRISDERARLMDTGGALTHALPLLEGYDYVLVHNTDVLSNLDLNKLCADFEAGGADALLVLQDRDTDRRLAASEDGRIAGWYNRKTGVWKSAGGAPVSYDAQKMRTYAYNGIHILKTSLIRVWRDLYGDEPFGLIDAYLRTADRHNIMAYFPQAPFLWRDMGKPAAFETPLPFDVEKT